VTTTPPERPVDPWSAALALEGALHCIDDIDAAEQLARMADQWRAEAFVAECAATHAAIDAAHIDRQRAWSEATFGPGVRLGVIDHIRKELREVEADPTDVTEWVDVLILAIDGAWRAGHSSQAIIDAVKAKQARNEAREWPDWRTMSPDQAIEHVRSGMDPVEREARRLCQEYRMSLPAQVSTEAAWQDFIADAKAHLMVGQAASQRSAEQ
jgi:hypothetical protein